MSPPGTAGARHRTVVVVDDDRDVREALEDGLVSRGYQVQVVPNGLKLLSALLVDKPDLILLDVMMPWINGFDLCLALKQNPEFRAIPLVFLSAMASTADVQRGLSCGAIDYITKPFDFHQLLSRVEELIGPP